jgi:hypothetical protein
MTPQSTLAVVWSHPTRHGRCVLLRVHLTPQGWKMTLPNHRDSTISGIEDAQRDIFWRPGDPIHIQRTRVDAEAAPFVIWLPLDIETWPRLDYAPLAVGESLSVVEILNGLGAVCRRVCAW